MIEYRHGRHGYFVDMLRERGVRREWADRAIREPDAVEDHEDGTRHFIKQIPEFGNRWLRVVVNVSSVPEVRIPALFDRRLRRAQ
mgnify:CR=1 FL=1